MSVSYNRLWKLLIDKNMNKTDFRDKIGISNGTLAKMGKNEYVALTVLEKICDTLDCRIEDIIEFAKDK
ncbi:MAG: helix-turn-helix domain-containing protein [Cellulosilyticaceae bacterium]